MEKDKMREYPNKLKLLYLKQILEQYTDDVNGLTHAEIMGLLKKKGVEVQPRTLRDDLQCLQDAADDFDMRIETNIAFGKEKAHPIRYKAEERLFSPTEVKLLMESVKGIHSLSNEQTEILHRKLESLLSKPQAKSIRNRMAVVGGFKAYWSKIRMQDVLLSNIEAVDRALDEGKQIEFRYYWYSWKKKPTYPRKKEHKHIVSPLVRVLEKGFYYLIAIDKKGRTLHYRMDRITNIAVSDTDNAYLNDKDLANTNWKAYVDSTFGLGVINKPVAYRSWDSLEDEDPVIDKSCQTVHMRLTRDMVGVVLDRFGRDVTISSKDKGHFEAIVNVYYNTQFISWVIGLGNKIRILSPEKIAKDISDFAESTGYWHRLKKKV